MYARDNLAHHRYRLHRQKHHLQGHNLQVAALGHCRPIKIPKLDPFVLERCCLCHLCLRCFQYFLEYVEPESLTNIPQWIELFKDNRGDKAMSIIVGNKSDLEK